MSTEDFFAHDYAQARAKFLAAAQQTDAVLWEFPHPLKGPDKQALALDIAWLGAIDASSIVVAGSATHGAEGFCGSGCQVGFLSEHWAKQLPTDTALVLVHANNPHGFAHLRRVNEDNIDLNRNFIDFSQPPALNISYGELHDWLVPTDWDGPARQAADVALTNYIQEHGANAYQQALSQGQYEYPTGLFYGGTGPCWSRRVLEGFARDNFKHAKRIGIVDFHTGLGPRGYGEIIGRGGIGNAQYERTRNWYGDEVRSAEVGDSSSVRLTGTIDYGYRRACPEAEHTAITLEFGTLPFAEVSGAIRGDNWLYANGGSESVHFTEIKEQMRAAFYGDDPQWKSDIWARGQQIVSQALVGISSKSV